MNSPSPCCDRLSVRTPADGAYSGAGGQAQGGSVSSTNKGLLDDLVNIGSNNAGNGGSANSGQAGTG
jgi:hypothetical protein